MYNTILFDLDGTLTDPGIGITNSVAYALAKWNIKVEDRTTLYKFIGPPLSDSFAEYYGFLPEQCQKAVEYYREYFKEKGIYENQVYPGVEGLLSELKKSGRKILLATSKPEPFALEILRHFGLLEYFDFVGGATMDETRCKKADVISYALESCGITDLGKAVMVGDREHDIIGARENRLDSIGVLYGYGSRKELEDAGAVYIAEKVEDIVRFV